MAKKKQPNSPIENTNPLLEEINALFGDIEEGGGTNDTIQRLKEGLFNLASMEDVPQSVYTYQHPNYGAQARPIAKYLKAIEQLEWDFDIDTDILEKILAKPKKKLVPDLENLIINTLAEHHRQLLVDDDEFGSSKLIVALLLLQEIDSKESLDLVLEVLRQDAPFMEIFFGDSSNEIFPFLIWKTGESQLPKLLAFMKEPGLFALNKALVVRAVANIAYKTPSRRLEVISWFCQLLNFLYEHRQENEIFDCFLIDSISYVLIEIQATETLQLLEKIYSSTHILPLLAPDIEGIRESISAGTPASGLDEPEELFEVLEDLEEYYYGNEMDIWDEESEEEDEEDYLKWLEAEAWEEAEEVEEVEEVEEEAISEEPLKQTTAKCFTLHITLENISPEVWRQVQVPSTITLAKLHTVIQTAMGWEDAHLHHFIKGKDYYLSSYEIKQSMMFNTVHEIDYTHVTLEQLLTRKGSKIKYEYDFGDSWMHEIKLEMQRPYEKGERPAVVLRNGANACPPEDCGGCFGYKSLQEAMKHPRSKAYREYIDWLGEPFQPELFDRHRVIKAFRSIKV